MMKYYLHKIRTTPFPILFQRLIAKLYGLVKNSAARLRDLIFDTHIKLHGNVDEIVPFANIMELDFSLIDLDCAAELLRMWQSHRFDLLGSGWIRCGYCDNAAGFETHRYPGLVLERDPENKWLDKVLYKRNVASAKNIWRLVSPDYVPIDWQKDFKSGYRWRADAWYRTLKWGVKDGADIKAPWELSRLQHLPRLAAFALLFPVQKENIVREFRDQCLDFIAQNPPRMGVNWVCTMDVGIRTANMALAYSLMISQGISFDREFVKVFITSVYEHCHHIRTNLEWSEALTANHYLADIAGLLFGASILPRSKKQIEWLAFSSGEMKNEIRKQFYEEGSNFEGSTAYHRLSGEMAAYCVALIAGREDGSVPVDISTRIYGAAKFMQAVIRPDGCFTQIGDNDSGVFFRMSITGGLCEAAQAREKYSSLKNYKPEDMNEKYLDENMNDCGTFIAAAAGLFGGPLFEEAKRYPLEYSLVRSLCKRLNMKETWKPPISNTIYGGDKKVISFAHSGEQIFEGENLLQGLESILFPSFGIVVFRSDELYMVINFSDNGQNGNGGHAHNDKLSVELVINGKAVLEDPGTYVYSPSPEMRNRYRGVQAHATIYTGTEQNEYVSMFSMKDQSKCEIISLSENSISLRAEYRDIVHIRTVLLEERRVVIRDQCNVPYKTPEAAVRMTSGYGKML